MQQSDVVTLEEARFEDSQGVSLVGLSHRYTYERLADISDQWQTFAPLIAQITTAPKPVTYGVIYNSGEESFDYLSGVELPFGAQIPANMVRLDLPAQTYAVFQHRGHVATVRETCHAIWVDWLPQSGKQAPQLPWFERYGEQFDPQTGAGGLEVWIPIAH